MSDRASTVSPRSCSGRRVGDRAEELPFHRQLERAGDLTDVDQPEVDDLVDVPALHVLVADDVGGLQVAVDDARVMGELQRAAQRHGDVEHFVHGQLSVERDALQQARAVEVLHDQERMALRIDVVVEDADDVGVPELRGGAALAQEAFAKRRVVRGARAPSRPRRRRAGCGGPDRRRPCRRGRAARESRIGRRAPRLA